MKIRLGVAFAFLSCAVCAMLSAQEKYPGHGFPLRPFEFLSSYRTFDAETAEVQYLPVKTLKDGDRLIAYRKIIIRVKTNSTIPWKKEFVLAGWMVGGYIQAMEWRDSCEEEDMSLVTSFSPIKTIDMKRIKGLILPEPGDKKNIPVWFWRGIAGSPW